MGERRGTKGLELWCRRMTEGYPGVNVVNMTTSWRDGLAFCAIIHHFRPDLIEFSKLNKDDIYHNNELAFRIAERHLGIPALLEPEDMVEFPVPDRLSILTYLSQFYQTFVVAQGKSSARIAPKRPATSPEHGIVSPASTSPPAKVAFPSVGKARREPCAKCGLPVFIAERLNVGKLLYHRTCFRCARCNSQLTLANYYETENNEFCCETCPDEEKPIFELEQNSSVLTRSLSDEEKSATLKKNELVDDYSAKFETALEFPDDGSLKRNSTLNSSQYSHARSFFISSQVGDLNSDSGTEDEPPDLPKTKPPDIIENSLSDSGFPNDKQKTNVNIQNSVSFSNASVHLEKSHDIVTKDAISAEGNTNSLVKARMRLFEAKSDAPNEIHSVNNKVPLKNSTSGEVGLNNNVEISNLHSSKDNNKNSSKETSDSLSLLNTNTQAKPVEESNDLIMAISSSNEDVASKQGVQVTLEHASVEEGVKEMNTDVNETPSITIVLDDSLVNHEQSTISPKVRDEAPSVISDDSSLKHEETLVCPKMDVTPPDIVVADESSLKHEENTTSSVLEDKTPPVIEISDDSPVKHEESVISPILEDKSPSIIVISDDSSLKDEKSTVSSELEDKSPSIIVISDDSSLKHDECTVHAKSVLLQNELNSKETIQEPLEPQLLENNKTGEHKEASLTEIADKYPDDLNPFGEDDEPEEIGKTVSLNPFEDDEDEVPEVKPSPKPAARKKIRPSAADKDISRVYIERISVNPFEEDDESEEKSVDLPQAAKRKVIAPPKISLNPFWSDDEEKDQDKPVPKPRISKTGTLEPKPRESGLSIDSSTTFDSISSVSSSQSGYAVKKKKLAPKPPSVVSGTESGHSSLTSSPCHSVTHSPRATPKLRKTKKAPLPPATSTPLEATRIPLDFNTSVANDFEKEKSVKDEVNRNRQSQNIVLQSPSSSDTSSSLGAPNKSTYGKWKRRKGQAPSRPIPQRRATKSLPIVEVRRELEVIEIQQQGLEKQGVRLEQIIRERCEGPNVNPDDSLPPEIEDMVLQLFELVNEKNELFRRQAELMYLRRQHKLEEEHADIEYQIRCLMLQPEANKTDSDKAREEELINRLVEIVERRNEIIECLEMDRVREAEEDDSINNQLNLYTLKKEEDKSIDKKNGKKDKKKLKKEKKSKSKGQKVDADKDIDESESSATSKDKKKKKFNLF